MSFFLVFFLLLTINITKVNAAAKKDESRAIAIVFDNSGSMYDYGDQSWCRATYATEVFASMLNKGDTLLIYPMNPFLIDGKEYTMSNPFRITDAAQANLIRNIYTPKAGDTHIESIDSAISGLQQIQADKKYMIVLSDGDVFYRNRTEMSQNESRRQLDSYFQQSNKNIAMMYLGIGDVAIVPNTPQSEFFVKKQAKNSADVLSALTDMCNRIFGRDTLPKNHISEKTVNFDVSINKLIVFVQGENISDLKLIGTTGEISGKIESVVQTKYSTGGCGAYNSKPDTSLQGMMVTYTDCAAGKYNISYSGTASSVEVYYEPDADLDFVFTDADGNTVDPNALYEGQYKVSFGMKDAKTGKLISSDLLGNPHYQGSYSINGKEIPVTYSGHSGEVPVNLKMNDTFDANLTVTYLSGYTISKDSSDFGWPKGGIKVAARPAGDLELKISGGADFYSLQYLENGASYIAEIFYQGEQLTGEELKKVELEWESDISNAEIRSEFAENHYKLSLHYKNSEVPQDTRCGECKVPIYATYSAKGSSEARTQSVLTYNIEEDRVSLQMDLYVPEDYIVIKELDDSQEISVKIKRDGQELTSEEFLKTELQVDCAGINYIVTACEEDSSYLIKLQSTENIEKGDYPIKVTLLHTDNIGRMSRIDKTQTITLSNIPLWLKWLMYLILLIILLIIILVVLHIKVLPRKAHINKRDSMMIFDGEDETKSTTFSAKIEKGQMMLYSKYAGIKTGVVMDVKPGKESYLRKSQVRRSADVKSSSVRKLGNAVVQEVSVGSVKYILNEDTGKLERIPKNEKPFAIKHGMTISYSGMMFNNGMQKPFTVKTKLNFKKR